MSLIWWGVRRARFKFGRALLVIGLRVLPRGRVRSELAALFDLWTTKVHNTLYDAATSKPS